MRSQGDHFCAPSLDSAPVLPIHLLSPTVALSTKNKSADRSASKKPVPKKPRSRHDANRNSPRHRGDVLGVIEQMLDIHDDILSDDDELSCSTIGSSGSYNSLNFGDDIILGLDAAYDDESDSSDDDDSSSYDSASSFSFSDDSASSSSSDSCITYLLDDQAEVGAAPSDELQQPTGQGGKRVHFYHYDDVQEVPHLEDYTRVEKAAIWMSRKELDSVRRECKRLARIIDERPHHAHFYKRGLHEHTILYNEKRGKVLEQLYSTVFTMQAMAIPGVDTPGTIADICCKLSEESATSAHEVGLLDEEAVMVVARRRG